MRRLEYKDAKSHKFWELLVEGDSYTVRYGKVGTNGQTQTKTCASHDKARTEGEKKLASKVKKGYVEVQVDQAAVAARDADKAKRNPKLEQAIFDDPSDASAWQVYGDWLQQQQDPHGELISLELQREGASKDARAKLDARIEELIIEHRDAWLAGAAKLIAKADEQTLFVDLRWEHGYVVGATISGGDEEPSEGVPTPDKVVRALIKSPALLFLRELWIGPTYDDDEWRGIMDKSVAAITKVGKLEALRSLTIEDPEHYWDISSSSVGRVSDVLPVAPRLRRLRVRGGDIDVLELEHDTLEDVSFETGNLDGSAARAICACKLPKATRLEIYFGSSYYGASGSIDHVRPLLRGEGVPKLERLGLKNAEFQDEIAAEIATSLILKQLTHLDMSLGTMREPGAQAILAHADKFAHLQELDLSDNFIPQQLCDQIVAALPKVKVKVSGQQDPSRWSDEPHYYVSVGE